MIGHLHHRTQAEIRRMPAGPLLATYRALRHRQWSSVDLLHTAPVIRGIRNELALRGVYL